MSSSDDNFKFQLDNSQREIINKNLDIDGKLSCLKAFSVARKIKHELTDMSAITKSMGIKISNCELGVFGKLDFLDKNEDVYTDLELNHSEKKLDCKIYWEESRKHTLRKVGSTVKNSSFEVINCQLGCFKEKKGKQNGS